MLKMLLGFNYLTAMTKRMFLDFLMVTLVTPGTCLSPSLAMIFLAYKCKS